MPEQQPARRQVGDERGVRVLEELPADQRDVGSNVPSGRTGLTTGSPYARATAQVLRAERRRLVDQTRTVLGGDVVGQHDVVRAVGEVHQVERPR